MDPARTALCLECRTALAPGEPCDVHKRAKIVDLADAMQRGRAVDAVWGPPHLRIRKAATVGSIGGGAGGLFEGCGGCADLGGVDGEGAIILLVIVIAFFVAIGLYFLVKRIAYWIREYKERPRPAGSAWKTPRSKRVLRGTVTAATGTMAPFSTTSCAAFGIVLEHDRATGGRTMLRDGATAGMTILLEDGRSIDLPSGRVRVEGERSKEDVASAYLKQIDPHHNTGDDNAVLSYDDGFEIRIAVGDTVEITGGLEEKFEANAPADFRQAPATKLVVAGIPTLVRV